MASVTVCSYECSDSGEGGRKGRKIKKSLVPFMGNCAVIEGTDEVVDDSRLDEDGYLIAAA